MKKYIIPVAAFLLIGTIANAQTTKKQPATTKPATTKPAATGSSKTSRPATKMAMADTTKHTTNATAMKRKPHPKATPKKETTK
jgi:hypothetical protein